MAEKEPIIRVRGLTVRFGERTILEDVSFDVHQGEIFGILGESGCGKTTLMRCLTGLLRPQSGEIMIDGIDVLRAQGRQRQELLRRFGVLFQSGALFKSMTLSENVAFPLREWTDLSDPVIEQLVRLRLAMVRLEGRGTLMPAELSGGMQKRGGLARAIALDPKILFFDEPSAGLDPVTSADLDELILKINAGLGTTMIVVTHELQSIYKIARRAIMLDLPTHRVIAEGAPAEMREKSEHPRVRAFFRRERLAEE